MNIPIESIALSLITGSALGILGVAWRTYNQFVVFSTKMEFVIERLEYIASNEKEIFTRLNTMENQITRLEAKN